MLAEVAAEPDSLDAVVLLRKRPEPVPAVIGTAIVDEDEFEVDGPFRKDACQTFEERLKTLGALVYWNDNTQGHHAMSGKRRW